jgi:hypothetical protein
MDIPNFVITGSDIQMLIWVFTGTPKDNLISTFSFFFQHMEGRLNHNCLRRCSSYYNEFLLVLLVINKAVELLHLYLRTVPLHTRSSLYVYQNMGQ